MRRSPRADNSPEVLRVSDSSPSSAESSFRELDDVFLQTQTRIWLGEVLHTRFDEETTIADLLADGKLLFQVSKVVWKMLQTKSVETKYLKACADEPTALGKSGGRYMPYSNVDLFLKICKILGLTGIDLFSPSDVVEKRDTRRVCMCIRSLSKKARSKHLNIPDFDVVTYTIAMPTDMVGYIRRSLEKSQCSSSTSVVCSRCLHSKRKYKQKIREVDCIRQFSLSSEESDDAGSSFQALEFQSPDSNASYGATTLSSLSRDNSPGRDSAVEQNFSSPENTFRLDIQSQHKDGLRTNRYGAVCFLESGEFSSCSMTHGNCQFSTENMVVSCQPCLGCQIDLNATNSCTHWRWVPENDREMYDTDTDLYHCRTSASSVRNSLNELDGLFLVDSKETSSGELCCNESMLWHENLRNRQSKLMSSDSYLCLDDMQEEFTSASVAPSDSKLIVSHVTNGGGIVQSEIGDCELSSLNSISGNAATLNCEDSFDVKDDFTGCNVRFRKFQNLGEVEQSNGTLQVSSVEEANLVKFSPKCRDLDSEIASKNVYWNQFDGILAGQLDSLCNGFTHNDIYKSSIVTNGNNGHGVSVECEPSYDIHPTNVCSCPIINSKDTGELFYANSTDKLDAMSAVSEPDIIVTKHLNDPSVSIACFTVAETAHEAENLAPKKVAVENSKTCLELAMSGLRQDDVNHGDETYYRIGDSEATFEGGVETLSVKQKESCQSFEMCISTPGAVKPLCSEETFTGNEANAFSERRQGETLLETKVAKISSTDGEEERCMRFVSLGESDVPHAKPLAITCSVTNEESVLESKGATISHLCTSLPNDMSLEKWDNWNSLLADFSEYKEKQQADVGTSGNKPMPSIDGNAGSTIAESMSQTERHRLEIEGIVFPVDFDEPCLDIPNLSKIGLETVMKVTDDRNCASELVFIDNLVHHDRFSCINSLEYECPTAQTLRSEPYSIPACLMSTSSTGMKKDDSGHLIYEKDPQMLGTSMSHTDADYSENMETENYEMDVSMDHNSEGRDTKKGIGAEHKRDKKLLLKSVAGGVTLFGALFLLLHLRRGQEKMGAKRLHGRTAPSQNQKQSQDRPQTGKAVGIYPSERLNLQ